MNNILNVFGENLKRLREKHNMSQKDLAEVLGNSDKTISKWENGNTDPGTEMIGEIAKHFNVSIGELTEGYISSDSCSNEDMRKVYEAINSLNRRVSFYMSNMVTEKYLVNVKASKKKEIDIYEKFTEYYESEEEAYEKKCENDVKDYEKSYALDIERHMNIDESFNICDAYIASGDADFAMTAIEIYDILYKKMGFPAEEEELWEAWENQRKYARILIHYLMNRFELSVDDLLENGGINGQ